MGKIPTANSFARFAYHLTCPSSCRSYCSYTRSKLDTRALCSFRLYLTSTVVFDLTFSSVCLRSIIVVLFSVTCLGSIGLGRRGDKKHAGFAGLRPYKSVELWSNKAAIPSILSV